MPFDPSGLPADTQLLIAVRDRLTPETWRPYSTGEAGKGCLIQWLHREAGDDLGAVVQAQRRLKQALPGRESSIGPYNDTHTLHDVLALLDRAIAA